MNKLASLNFDNANNACQSLRMLAEWVRAGDIAIEASKAAHLCEPISADLIIGFQDKGRDVPR